MRITAARLDDGDDELLAAKMHAASLERRRPSLTPASLDLFWPSALTETDPNLERASTAIFK